MVGAGGEARGADRWLPLFVPNDAIVVLLNGVPGDLESETTYRDQITTWGRFVESTGRARRVYFLADQPAGLTLPEETSVRVANRTNFLALGKELAGTTNPVVVIAWGHAGKQGSAPVFHVRGPRITAEDFEAFAESVAAPSWQWVLMFRGSGAFASRVAGSSSLVVSSDAGTVFGSDPLGMTVLLGTLREKTKAEARELFGDFGRAVGAWYEERNLARTEEPMLWAGDEKPEPLVKGGSKQAAGEVASDKPRPEPEQAEAEPAKSEVRLPASWGSVRQVSPQAYPNADAVSLLRKVSYTLGSNPAISSETEEYIQVLTVEGKRFGDFDVSYTPPYEDVTFLDCEVMQPDGRVSRLDPEAIRESGAESLGDYQFSRRKFFSLPGVGPGAVLHVRYRSQWKSFPLPHISLEIPIAGESPAVEVRCEVSVAKESAFHFAFENFVAPDPEVRQTTYGATYQWKFADLPGAEAEVLVAPRRQPRLLISTFPNWRTFAEWYGRLTRLTAEADEGLTAKARELVKQVSTDREKVAALYDYVTRMRYVAVPMGVNSFRPHAATNVFRNQYGDCKDKANLLNTMLGALGIEAHLVLVPRFSQAREQIPGLSFNHAISKVVLPGETLWVDTTDDVCRFGMLPPGDPGRRVLVIDGRATNLVQLPLAAPADHRLELVCELNEVGASGGSGSGKPPDLSCPTTLRVKARGFPDYALRSQARVLRSHARTVPLLAADYQTVAGGLSLTKQDSSLVSALDQDFSWGGSGEMVGCVAGVAGEAVLVSVPFWLPDEWVLALHQRKAPLYLNHGYPLILDEQVVVSPAAGLQAGRLPTMVKQDSEPLRWQLEWERSGTNGVTARFRAELARGELDPEESLEFQKQLRRLRAALAQPLELGRNAAEGNRR